MTEREARELIEGRFPTYSIPDNSKWTPTRGMRDMVRIRITPTLKDFATTQYVPIKKLIAFLVRFKIKPPPHDDGFNWLTGRMEDEG